MIPAVKVEIAFNAGYSTPAGSRTWTNVTQWVRFVDGIDITYGRDDERSQAGPNTLRLTLMNSDGRFTPGLASSPYYPNVKIGRPIRVTSTPAGGSASVRFVGYIDEWPLEWPAVVETFATSRITATSRLARLGLDRQLRSIVEEEILLDDPVAYFTMGEAEGATTAADSSGNSAQTLVMGGSGAAVTFGTATGPGTDGLTAAQIAGGACKWLSMTSLAAAGSLSVEFECFAAVTAGNGEMMSVSNANGDHLSLGVYGTGEVAAVFHAAGGSDLFVDGGVLVDDNIVRHFALRATLSAGVMTIALYLDGVSLGTDSGAFAAFPDLTKFIVGDDYVSVTASIAHAAVFVAPSGLAISDTRIAAHAAAGLTGFEGETPTDRIDRYATYVALPIAEIDADTGNSPMAHVDTTGQTAADMLHLVEATEGGVLFDGRDGTLEFRDRDSRYLATTALTLDAGNGEVGAEYLPKLDRTSLLNDVTATTTDGTVTARAVDQTSIDDYGRKNLELQLATTDANEPHAAAWWRVNAYAQPRARVPQLQVEIAHMSTAFQASVLALDVGSRLGVSNLPSQSDAASKSFFVEGYSEHIGETYSFSFNVSDATAYVGTFVLDSATRGKLDTNALAY